MPTVIGFDKELLKKCTCKDCTAIIEYKLSERKSATYTDMGGFVDGYYYITCPNCGKNIEVK